MTSYTLEVTEKQLCGYHSPVFAMDDKGRNLTYYLTDENTIWSKFCESELAEKLSKPL